MVGFAMEKVMSDAIYVGTGVALFALCALYARFCARL